MRCNVIWEFTGEIVLYDEQYGKLEISRAHTGYQVKIICGLTKEHEEEVESKREGETDGEAHCLRERNTEEPGLIEQRQRLEHGNRWNRTAVSA